MAGGIENLRVPTPEEARRNGRKGGIASGKARKAKKQRAEIVDEVLNHGLDDEKRRQAEVVLGKLKKEDASVFTLMLAGIVRAAVGGNVSAFETVMEMAESGKAIDGETEDELSKSLRELGESL